MAKKLTKEQMLEAIKNSNGLVTKIQKKLEALTKEPWNWQTVERHIHKWEECELAVKAEKEAMLDLAENNIFNEIVGGDTGTSKWYLRMKGKERGYEDTPIVKLDNRDPLNINLQGELFSADELEACGTVKIEDGGD